MKKTNTSAQHKHTISIRWVMFLIMLIMGLSNCGLIYSHWQLSIEKGRAHIDDMQTLQNEQVLRAIEGQFGILSSNISTLAKLFTSNAALINDEPSIKQTLMTLALNSPNLATITVADETNNYYSMFRPEGDEQLMYARAKHDGVMISGTLNEWQEDTQALRSNKGFYANQRPWFSQAIGQPGINWTPVYTYHSSGSLAIGASQAVTNSNNEKVVVAADFLLNNISTMLQVIGDQQDSVLLLLDHKKNIIANSVGEDQLKTELLTTFNAYMTLISAWLDKPTSHQHQLGDLLISKQLINQQGINQYWLINVASQSTMLTNVNKYVEKLVWISAIVLVLAILVFNLLAKLLFKPIVQLAAVSKQISLGNWNGEVPASHIEELNNLSKAYQFMANEMKTTLHNLESKVLKRTLSLEQLNKQLKKSSLTDPLTFIANRRFFNEQMDQYFATPKQLYLAMIDIDHFKQYNDKYGHVAGDQALQSVSALIQQNMAGPHTDVARIGGEEFAVINTDNNINEFIEKLRAMQVTIAKQAIISKSENIQETLTVSIGVAVRFANENDWNEIYARADKALYEAKAQGRNCLVFPSDVSNPPSFP